MAHVAADLIRKFEEQLLDPGFRRDRAAVADLLADEFQEFGSSGQRYDKQQILAVLAEEQAFSASLSAFEVQGIASGCVLATYQAYIRRPGHGPQGSLRSSLWLYRNGRWQMLFHQGTPVPESKAKK